MSEPGAGPASLPALAARAQLGDRSALETLLRRLQPPLLDHILGIVRDDDAGADVLQDVLIIICRRLGTVREVAWVRAWAYRIATREAVRAIRRSRRRQGVSLDDMPDIADTIADGAAIEDEALLAALPGQLAALPMAAQVALRMHYLQALTQQEIAEALEIPIGTVKSRLAYGLMWLRRSWTPPRNG